MRNDRSLKFMLFVAALLLAAGQQLVLAQPPEEHPRPKSGEPLFEKIGQPTGKVVATLDDFAEWVTSVAWSPDGKWIATGSYDSVKIWNAETFELAATLATGSGYARGLAWSPDSEWLAIGGYQSLTLWDGETHQQHRAFTGHRAYVTSVAFSSDGASLASSSEDETVRLWDVATGNETLVIRAEMPVQAVAFSPDGHLLATAEGDETRLTKPGAVKLWNADGGTIRATLPEHAKAATGIAFSPAGDFLVSTSLDETCNVYDVADTKALGFFKGHSRPTTCALVLPDGSTVVTGSGGRFTGANTVKFWNRETGEEFATLSSHTAPVTDIALSPEGKRLVTTSQDKTALIWDIEPILQVIEKAAP